MQPGSRCSDRTLDARIDGLISRLVALFGLAVQVRRDWQFTYGIQDLGKRHMVPVPLEPYGEGVTERLLLVGAERERSRLKLNRPIVPFLSVSHHTFPRTPGR